MAKIPLKLFLLGLLWAALSGCAPAFVLIQDDIAHNDITDWAKVRRVSALSAGAGALGFWRKNRALLQIPPGLEGVL